MVKKNHNKKRKIATYALASALVLSNFAAVAPTSAATYKPGDLESKVKQMAQLKSREAVKTEAKKAAATAKADLKATDKVRVIVEVEGQTPVEFATKEGKLYKQLSEDTKSSLDSKLVSAQKSVKDKLKSKGVNIQYKQSYKTAFNGFSGEVAFGELDKIEATAGVKKVYLANEYNRPVVEPNMKSSHQFVQSRETWADTGYKGEGMVVAVIDTGVDPSHKDFVLTDNATGDLTKEEVAQAVAENGLKGKFHTEKVPYGYNYFDQNNEILDLGPGASRHGMHVAGTVAANGDEATGGIKGVAPEAQVLAMKVFSNDPLFGSTWSDVYLAAIDDSIKLGADVLNMSLGSVASFYDEDSAEDLAIQRATANGIVAAMSAGNSNHIGDGFIKEYPYAQNPDIGVVGAPGLNPDTISVAASGNVAFWYQHTLTVEGNTAFSGLGKGIDDLSSLDGLEIVSLGDKLGSAADYEGLDVKGKVVLVPRGSLTFFDKTVNAAAAGAAGIIVWNATNGFWFEDQGGWDVPFTLISKADGEALNAAIAAGQKTLHTSQLSKSDSPEMGRMTAFTSWGTTPSLELKPEITAPGGNIYSTDQNNKYQVMSGTSMASPHVAGGSALVQQYLQTDERFSDLSVADRTALAKVLLMNTASVIEDLNGQPFSPRRQGAGMMQTKSAVTTPAYVVNKSNGEAKVELKDFQSKQFELNLAVTNISDKSVTYSVDTSVLTDTIQQQAEGPEFNALIAGDLEGAKVTAPATVTVPAGKTVEVPVKVDLAAAKIPGFDAAGAAISLDLREDIFVEGSVSFTDVAGAAPSLTVPYVGFYGNWDNPDIVDGFATMGEDKFLDLTGFGIPDVEIDELYFGETLPDKNVFALSPNGDTYYENMNPIPSFLRNATEVQYNILDKDGNQLRRVKAESDVVKNAVDGNLNNAFSWKADRLWDGKVKGEVVEDGLYYYEIKSVIDYADAEWQSKKIPVLIDTTAPKVTATYEPETSTVSWTTVEEGSGVYVYGIFVNGVLVGTTDGTATSYQIVDAPAQAVVEVVAIDNVENAGQDTAAIGDVDIPLIYINDEVTVPYGAYDGLEIPVEGYVEDQLGLKTIKVNGKEVDFEQGEDGNYHFSTTVTYEKDGAYDVIVEAVDHDNKTFSIARKIYIDTTKPVINVTAPERVDKNVDKATIKVNLQDNFNYLNFFVGEDHEFEVPFKSPVDVLTPLSKDYEVTVPLKEGENKVVLRATDLSGNETIKEVVIQRKDSEKPPVVKDGWKLENGTWFFYKKDVKATGWLLDAGKWYYLKSDGAMATGWIHDGKAWYYLTKSGAMATGWVYDGGAWYYLTSSGAMKTGWLLEGSTWYYLNTNGSMATGWKLVNGKWYYMYKSGAMAVNTYVDGYKIGKDGAWIK